MVFVENVLKGGTVLNKMVFKLIMAAAVIASQLFFSSQRKGF